MFLGPYKAINCSSIYKPYNLAYSHDFDVLAAMQWLAQHCISENIFLKIHINLKLLFRGIQMKK